MKCVFVDSRLGFLTGKRFVEGLPMKERRSYERFRLKLPTRMAITISNKQQIFNLHTKDISAAGAFIRTAEQLPEGAMCRLELTIPSNRIKELTGAQSLIKVEGTIVRSTPEGVAICFDGDCQILRLRT